MAETGHLVLLSPFFLGTQLDYIPLTTPWQLDVSLWVLANGLGAQVSHFQAGAWEAHILHGLSSFAGLIQMSVQTLWHVLELQNHSGTKQENHPVIRNTCTGLMRAREKIILYLS